MNISVRFLIKKKRSEPRGIGGKLKDKKGKSFL
jgi:hypothetical protein